MRIEKLIIFFLSFFVLAMPLSFPEDLDAELEKMLKSLEETVLDQKTQIEAMDQELLDAEDSYKSKTIQSRKDKLIFELKQQLNTASQKQDELSLALANTAEEIARLKQEIGLLNKNSEVKDNELNQLRQQIAGLDDKDKLISELKEKLKATSQKQGELSAKLDETDEEIIRLNQNIAQLKKDIRARDDQNQALADDKETLTSKLKQQLNTASQKQDELSLALANTAEEIARLKQEIGLLNKNSEVKDNELNQLRQQIAGLDDKDKLISELKEKLKATSQKQDELSLALANTAEEIARLKQEIGLLNKNSEVKDNELNQLRQQIAGLDDKDKLISELKEKLKATSQKQGELSAKLDETDEEIIRLNKKIVEFKQEIQALQEENQSFSHENEDLISKLKDQLNTGYQIEKGLIADIDNANRQITRLKQQINELKKDIQARIAENERFSQDRDILISQFQEELAQSSQKQNNLSLKLNNADKEIASLNQNIAQLNKDIKSIDNRNQVLSQEKDKLTSQLKEQLNTGYQKESELSSKLNAAREEAIQLKQEVSLLKESIGAKIKDVDKEKRKTRLLEKKYKLISELSQEKDKLISPFKKKLSAALKKQKELTLELSKVHQDLNRLNQKIAEFKKDIEAKERKNKKLTQDKDDMKIKFEEDSVEVLQRQKDLTSNFDKANKEIVRLKEKVAELKKNIKSKDKYNQSLSQDNDKLILRLKEFSDLKQKMAYAEDDIEYKDKKIEELSKEKDKLASQLKQSVAKVNDVADLEQSMDIIARKQTEKLQEKEKLISQLRDRLTASSQRESELVSKLDKTSRDYARLYKDVTNLKEDMSATVRQRTDKLQEKEKLISQLRDKLTVSSQRESELVSQLDKASENYSRLSKDIVELKEVIETIDKEKRSSPAEKILYKPSPEQQQQLDSLRKELSIKEKKVTELDHQVIYLKKDIEAKDDLITKLQEKLTLSFKKSRVKPSPSVSSTGPMVRVHFKDGRIVEGRLTQDTERSIKVDSVGVPLSYYKDGIDKIERLNP